MSLAGVTENPSLPRERDNTSSISPSTPRLPHENIMQQHNHNAATVTNNASRKPCMRNGEERKGAEVMHGAESRTGSTPNHRRYETPIQPMIRKNKRIPSAPVVRITKNSEVESRKNGSNQRITEASNLSKRVRTTNQRSQTTLLRQFESISADTL